QHERAGHECDAQEHGDAGCDEAQLPRPQVFESGPPHSGYAPIRLRWSMTASAVGSASSSTTRPSARNTTRVAYEAPTGSCVTMTTVWSSSSTARLRNCRISALATESRFPVGSSAKMIDGFDES